MATDLDAALARLDQVRAELFNRPARTYPPNATLVVVEPSPDAADGLSAKVFFDPDAPAPPEDPLFDTTERVPPAKPLAASTESGTGIVGDGGRATLGWSIEFQGNMAFITSRHAVVDDFSVPERPQMVHIEEPPGSAVAIWSPSIEAGKTNMFDIAVCAYVNGEGAAAFRDGGPYSLALSTKPVIDVDVFACTGAVSRAEGMLRKVADVLIDYDEYGGGKQWLQRQLLLELKVAPGDSGALVRRTTDNTATGLLCALTSYQGGYAIANPLYRIKWTVEPGGTTKHPLPIVTPTQLTMTRVPGGPLTNQMLVDVMKQPQPGVNPRRPARVAARKR